MKTRIIQTRCAIIDREGISADAKIVRVAMTRSIVGGISVTIPEDEGMVHKIDATTFEAIKTARSQPLAPTPDDDSSAGFSVGSQWYTTAPAGYICVDATETAAVWVRIGGTVTTVATIAELYAAIASGKLNPGDAFVMTTPLRAGVISDDSELVPDPFTGFPDGFPCNESTLEIGLASEGKVEVVQGSVTLDATGLKLVGNAIALLPALGRRMLSTSVEWRNVAWGSTANDWRSGITDDGTTYPNDSTVLTRLQFASSVRLRAARRISGTEVFFNQVSGTDTIAALGGNSFLLDTLLQRPVFASTTPTLGPVVYSRFNNNFSSYNVRQSDLNGGAFAYSGSARQRIWVQTRDFAGSMTNYVMSASFTELHGAT